MKKKMPEVGADHYGERAARRGTPYDVAEAAYRLEQNPDPLSLRMFHRGYLNEQINDRIRFLWTIMRHGKLDQLKTLLEDINELAVKWGYEPD